jgi:GDP-L-fucose synthase
MKSNLIITGSTGVLGSSFKNRDFLKKNQKYNFIFLNSRILDLRNLDKTLIFFLKIKPRYVIHLAAVSGGIGFSNRYQASLLRDNIYMAFNILEASRKTNVKKLIMTLTTGMYPEKAKLPLVEECIHSGEPTKNNFGSSFAKRIIEPAIRAYREEYKLDVIGLVPSGIFGENDNFNLDHAPMLPATINKILNAKKNNLKKVEIWGSGKPLREYTYSNDYRDIYMWALKNYSNNKIINISSGQEYSIKEIVKKICNILDYDFKNVFFNNEKDGIFKKTTCTKYLQSLVKFKFTDFDISLKKTIEWYVNNQSKLNLDKVKLKKF